MRRHEQYSDPVSSSLIAAAQMQMSAQRSQHVSDMNQYPVQRESLHPESEYQYRQWERNVPRGSNPPPPQMYREGADMSQSAFQAQRPDSRITPEKPIMDSMVQGMEQSKDVGYADGQLPRSFEGLEQKFFEDINKLAKEQQDAEDAENGRHRERLAEINAQYQEKLLAIRASQTAQREEFLRKESQIRLQKYQEESMNNNHPQTTSPGGPRARVPAAAGDPGAYGDYAQMYGRDHQYESYRDRSRFSGADRSGALESRGPYPGGRAYNTGGRQF